MCVCGQDEWSCKGIKESEIGIKESEVGKKVWGQIMNMKTDPFHNVWDSYRFKWKCLGGNGKKVNFYRVTSYP